MKKPLFTIEFTPGVLFLCVVGMLIGNLIAEWIKDVAK